MLAIIPENQIINWKIKFGTANKKPKNGNILTIITRAKTIMYAAEKSGTQIRFVSHEKKEILPKYIASTGDIAKVVHISMASAADSLFGILHLFVKNFESGCAKMPMAITLRKLIKKPAS